MATPVGSPDPFAELNLQQAAAVAHGEAPLLVIAGAGSGKTTTLAARVARLVRDGADPERLLLLTFSRRAAQQMTHRAGVLLQQALGLRPTQRPPALPWAGTFHAIGARLLREWAPAIGLADSFTILDRADAEDLMNLARQELSLCESQRRFPLKGTCLGIYSRTVNSAGVLADVLRDHYPWCAAWETELKALFGHYVDLKQRHHVIDYDDLLLYWAQAMTDPGIAAHAAARFDHVLVDEYQDTNRLQGQILRALRPHGHGLTVVGDDAQSIYAFRAADVRNILDFPQQFGAEVIALEQNYRSTPGILDASNEVIAAAGERHAKRLWSAQRAGPRPQLVTVADDAHQARWIVDEVLRQRETGLLLRRQAVLFRTAHHSAGLELELTRRRVPFVKYGGLKFLESSHVKDVLSVLRWVQNPRGRIAGFRCALLVPGIGPATARRLLDAMEQAVDPAATLLGSTVPRAAHNDWAAFRELYAALRDATWPDQLDPALQWYQPQLERLHDDAPVRLADLRQLRQMAAAYPSRERFLSELTLDPPQASSDEPGAPHLDEDYLILSTIHSAKGQEWSAVHVLNVVDGCIPSEMATGSAAEIDEERRLLYVAMTRAKRHLHLLVPQRFFVTQQPRDGDRHLYATASRFLTPAVMQHLDAVVVAVADDSSALAPPPGHIDIGERVRSAWR